MSLAVAAAALDRALKGTASTMHPPQLPPRPPLHLHRKSFSTFRENATSYELSVPPSPRRFRSHCDGIRPQSMYKTEQYGRERDIISGRNNAERNYSARKPFVETGSTKSFHGNAAHAEPGKCSNMFVGSSMNNDRYQRSRNGTGECESKFYSIPRFPFRGTNFNDSLTHPCRNFRIRSYSSDSPTRRNEYEGRWKSGRLNSPRTLYARRDPQDVRSTTGPFHSSKKSFINSSLRKSSFSTDREKAKGKCSWCGKGPPCSADACCKHAGYGINHTPWDSHVAHSENNSAKEKHSSQNHIECSKRVEKSVATDGLKTDRHKPEFETMHNQTGFVTSKAVKDKWKESTEKSSNNERGTGESNETENLISSSATPVEDGTKDVHRVSCGKIETFVPLHHGSKTSTTEENIKKKLVVDNIKSSGCVSNSFVGSFGWENGQSSHCTESDGCSEESRMASTFSNLKATDSSPEILEFRSICEERNGSIIVKPDIASEILKECLSSSDAVEERSKSDCKNASEQVDIENSFGTSGLDERESRNRPEDEANSMFDFIYHSETDGFKSSSPKKRSDGFAKVSQFDVDESEYCVAFEKRSGRKTASILSLIKSSREKLLAAGTSKKENIVDTDFLPCAAFEPTSEGRENIGENGREVEMIKATCESTDRNQCDLRREETQTNSEVGKTRSINGEACVLSVSLNDMGPFMTTRWRGLESEAASNLREEFQGYHGCEKFHSQESKYKTELCRAFQIRGSCRYGSRCNYAHGLDQLKVSFHHGKYKTRNCQAYHESGYCRYGARCSFIHDLEEGILKCSIANKEILEALHHWPEEEGAVDRSATVTWRVFTGCSNNHNETMLEFAAIPSLRPADIDDEPAHSPPLGMREVPSPGSDKYTTREDVSQSRKGSKCWMAEPDTLHPARRLEAVNSRKIIREPRCENSFHECDLTHEHKDCPGRDFSMNNNVSDLLTLLRSVETESISIHRSYAPSSRDPNQPREMRIVSTFPCSRQNEFFSRQDFYNYRTRTARQRCGNSINLDDESLSDLNRSRTEIMKKRKKCFSFHHKGFCLYGPNCLFVHDE